MKRFFSIMLCMALATAVVSAQSRVIPIETDAKGYYVVVDANNRVWSGYFGDKLADSDQLDDLFLSGTTPVNKVPIYPTFGSGFTDEMALKIVHADGNMTTRLIYDSHETTTSDDGNVVVTEVMLRDEYYPLSVSVIYKAYKRENVITISSVITNGERGEVVIEGAMSSFMTVKANDYWLTRYYGSWAGEMHLVESKIEDGVTVIDSKRGIRTTQDGSPSFILSLDMPASETRGEVVVGSLAWSGNYKLTFDVTAVDRLNIGAGINDFMSDYTLRRSESFTTPEFVVTHSNNGVGEASRNLHRWVRRYNIQDGDTPRPIVLNSWEGAYFRFDEEIIVNMIKDAASMGVEMFVLDDGWFGTKYPRNSDKMGLGDWQINYEKLPHGLSGLIDCAAECGIDFGLWVEPEMVNPKSELAEKHPDWIVTSPNREHILARSQLLLDLSNPKVKEFVYDVVASYLTEYPGIKYIKWDANRHVEDFGSAYLDRDKQSHFWVDYIRNLYEVYDRLAEAFPDVIFQACSSGGGRVDYGSLRYHHEVWGSDNTDAIQRIYINWGLNQYVPSMAVASHVSQSPNHQTQESAPIKFRFDVAMAQRLGIELQPKNLTPEELEWTKQGVAVYKERIRPVVQLGDQYRLVSPYSGKGFASTMYVSEDQSQAVVFAYSLNFHFNGVSPIIKLQGLSADKNYRIEEILPKVTGMGKTRYTYSGNGRVVSGDMLMKYGMNVGVSMRYASGVYMLTEEK